MSELNVNGSSSRPVIEDPFLCKVSKGSHRLVYAHNKYVCETCSGGISKSRLKEQTDNA